MNETTSPEMKRFHSIAAAHSKACSRIMDTIVGTVAHRKALKAAQKLRAEMLALAGELSRAM